MFISEVGMIILGILCGSLLFSRFLPLKLKRVDVEKLSGDHNPGAANAIKYAGAPVGIFCLMGDIFKGTIPVHLAVNMELMTGSLFPLIMAAPVFGHAYSLFHHGRGGKAIAVSFGVMIGLLPLHTEPLFILCILYLFFSLVVVIRPHTRRTRITFLLFAASILVLGGIEEFPMEIVMGVLMVTGIVVYKNRISVQRLEELRNANTVLREGEAGL